MDLEDCSPEDFANSRLNPTYRMIRYMHDSWWLNNLGPRSGGGVIAVSTEYRKQTSVINSDVKRSSGLWGILRRIGIKYTSGEFFLREYSLRRKIIISGSPTKKQVNLADFL